MKTIIVASNNKNKLREIKAILADLNFNVLSLEEAGIEIDPEETGKTFEDNALIKARATRRFTESLIISDDSGLTVDCLDGLPGVKSRRFAGESATDTDNNQYLIKSLRDIKAKNSPAEFICTIALIDESGNEFLYKGNCKGKIISRARGTNGFGYDPYFYIPELKKTMAQLSEEEKNTISHRGKALRMVKQFLESKYK